MQRGSHHSPQKGISIKTQTLGKLTSHTGSQEHAPPHPHTQLTPFIDKISLVIDPLDEDRQEIHAAIFVALSDKAVFQNAGTEALKGWSRAQLIALSSSLQRPLLQYRYEKVGSVFQAAKLRLEFNPRKLGEQGLLELDAVLVSIMPNGWAYVIEQGRITRIDVAVDVPGIRMDGIHFVPKQGASEIHWGRDGHLEGFRHGKSKGNQTAVYGVKQKRLAKKQDWTGLSTVRIERRLRNPSPFKLQQLGEMKNPFAGLAFTMMPGPPPDEAAKTKQWMWSMFEDSVRVRGMANALALVPALRRTKYRAYLDQHPTPWWHPDVIWKNWPTAYNPLVQLK